MTKAVRIEKTGGPEVMQLVAVDLAKPTIDPVTPGWLMLPEHACRLDA